MRTTTYAHACRSDLSAGLRVGRLALHGGGRRRESFEVGGGVTRGMGGPLFSFEGELEVAGEDIAADLGKTGFAREHVAQYWLDDEDLRLLLYREREGDKPHGYVELTIETKARGDDGEGFYDGRYELTVFDATQENGGEGVTLNREGDVVCSAE